MMRTPFLSKWLKQWLLFWIFAVFTQSIGRLVLYVLFLDKTVREQFASDVFPLFLKGLQFDIKMASLLVAVPVVLGLLSLLHQAAVRVVDRLQAFLLTLLGVLLVGFTVGNVLYFKTYERQFDVFVFGLFEEDTQAVLQTIWADYPIVSGVIGLAVVAYLLWKVFRAIHVPQQTIQAKYLFIITFAAVLLLAVGIRGSLGKFPLRQDAAQISISPQINRLIPNALIALDWARKEHRNSSQFHPVSDADGIKFISAISGQTVQSADLKQFNQITPQNPAAQARLPNVAFVVMESMSGHLLQLHDNQRDFLGRLAPHWQNDWLFQRFVSEGDGTSDSLHRLLVRSPFLNLSQSSAKNKKFISNMFQPYLDAGYDVLYITAGNGGWRDFDAFLRHLGVHEFVDENTLKQRYPEAASSTWGVPDEFMFRYAAERLAQAEKSGKSLFVMMLSVTNHPPYQLPAPHQKIQFALNDKEKQRLSNLAQGEQLNEILNTFRYANDQLGGFIDAVKQNAPHTIIAATGDHNMRAINYPDPSEAALGHAVPFYLFVPSEYRANAVYRPERVGSHKDIMPTLYELSLPQKSYYQNGCSLTAVQSSDFWCDLGYNSEVVLLNEGFYNLHSQTFFRWTDANRLQAVVDDMPSESTRAKITQAQAYTAFLEWQLNKMVQTQ